MLPPDNIFNRMSRIMSRGVERRAAKSPGLFDFCRNNVTHDQPRVVPVHRVAHTTEVDSVWRTTAEFRRETKGLRDFAQADLGVVLECERTRRVTK